MTSLADLIERLRDDAVRVKREYPTRIVPSGKSRRAFRDGVSEREVLVNVRDMEGDMYGNGARAGHRYLFEEQGPDM